MITMLFKQSKIKPATVLWNTALKYVLKAEDQHSGQRELLKSRLKRSEKKQYMTPGTAKNFTITLIFQSCGRHNISDDRGRDLFMSELI